MNPEKSAPPPPAPRFFSLRWRALWPVTLVVTVLAMVGAYLLAGNLSRGVANVDDNILLQNTQTALEMAVNFYERQRTETQRVAYTIGVPEALRARQSISLHAQLEGIAAAAGLDSLIVTDAEGVEVAGLLLTETSDFTDYAVSTDTLLRDEPLVTQVIDEGMVGASGLMRTAEGLFIYTAAPIVFDGETVGVVLAGNRLLSVLEAMSVSAVANVALYDAQGQLLETTLDLDTVPVSQWVLDTPMRNQILSTVGQVVTPPPLALGGASYRVAYAPFHFGPNTLGIIGVFVPNNVPFATEIGRQMTALLVSALTGGVVISVFLVVSRISARAQKVSAVAQALAVGEGYRRTGMKATDEISAIGEALDQYAEATQARHDKLREMLRKQRREVNYFVSVLESMPDGIIIQDISGRVLLMNDHAKTLIGSQRVYRSSGLHELSALIGEEAGQALAPGLYALGDPQRVTLDGRMLSAQAVGVLSATKTRIGTVIILRDITSQVREDQAREALLSQLSREIQQPLAILAQTGARSPNDLVHAFAREISRYSAALQKMIVDMRELHQFTPQEAKSQWRPLRLEALIWAVANDWRQIAQAAGLTLHVIIEQKGVYVLGDERRLRWALGNIADNAIKYTEVGGAMTLEIKSESEGMVHLRVRDNGVGIHPQELEHVFVRFYRGTPVNRAGEVIRVPGMGQGLSIAQQIIEAHGGRISVKSKPLVGTAVYISLPVTAPVAYELPFLDADVMEGETVQLPPNLDIDAFWQPVSKDPS